MVLLETLWKAKEKEIDMNQTKMVCSCMNITYGKLEKVVLGGAYTPEAVIAATGYGKGCRRCLDLLPLLIWDILRENNISQEGLQS